MRRLLTRLLTTGAVAIMGLAPTSAQASGQQDGNWANGAGVRVQLYVSDAPLKSGLFCYRMVHEYVPGRGSPATPDQLSGTIAYRYTMTDGRVLTVGLGPLDPVVSTPTRDTYRGCRLLHRPGDTDRVAYVRITATTTASWEQGERIRTASARIDHVTVL